MARPFEQASEKVEGQKPTAQSQVCIARLDRKGIDAARKPIGLRMIGTHRRQVENGTRSQNIAIGLEVNALCREVDHEVEIACSDLIEFENQGVSLVLERDLVPTKYRGLREEQTDQ